MRPPDRSPSTWFLGLSLLVVWHFVLYPPLCDYAPWWVSERLPERPGLRGPGRLPGLDCRPYRACAQSAADLGGGGGRGGHRIHKSDGGHGATALPRFAGTSNDYGLSPDLVSRCPRRSGPSGWS